MRWSLIPMIVVKVLHNRLIMRDENTPFRKLPILGYPLLDGRQSAPV